MIVHSCSRSVNRFFEDPLKQDAETMITFETMLRVLVAHKPPTFVLENVMGTKSSSQQVSSCFTVPRASFLDHERQLRMRRVNKADEQDPDACAPDLSKYKCPLDYCLDALQKNLPGYTLAVVEIDSHPLPEERKRVWILGSSSVAFSADAWKKEVLALEQQQLPKHHLSSFFKLYGQQAGATMDVDADKDSRKQPNLWDAEKKYSAAYAAAVEKAVQAKRLSDDFKPPPRHERPSAKMGKHLTPWMQANCDVYSAILLQQQREIEEQMPSIPRAPFPVADVMQSVSRGHLSLSGHWGTLCTSSKLMHMDTFQLMPGRGMLAMLGNTVENHVHLGLSESELASLAGNSMSFTQLSRVLLPLVAHRRSILTQPPRA
ncbi:unnamed protein product [Symbiodinium sp. CCMP2592]|nr:unnamed protein product [Symbiodinium sp. CCMP2592]